MNLAHMAAYAAADAAARIEQADNEAAEAQAAFAAGRFPEYWAIKAQQLKARLEAEGERAITSARGSGAGN